MIDAIARECEILIKIKSWQSKPNSAIKKDSSL